MNSTHNGQSLKEMFTAATNWLEKSAPDIDAMNVFPVPDGDTGTNMLLTMRSTMEEAYHAPDSNASAVMQAMAKGALIGARGNSGVILSQILRGLADGLAGKMTFNGLDFAQALLRASSTAYKALSQPVEGTILTVIRDSSLAAQEIAPLHPEDLLLIMDSVVRAARDSVAKTPTLNSVLQEAGVVDAGGQGLYILFEGILLHLSGETEEIQYRRPRVIPSSTPLAPRVTLLEPEVPYGYCTNFVLKGEKLRIDRIRRRLERKGQSVIVVGDDEVAKIHIHTLDPGATLRYAISLGTLHEIEIKNMDDLHIRFVEKSRSQIPATRIAIVAIASGEGITKVFESLGATAVIPGGQTMNPSVRDVLRVVERLPQDKVIILPNNSNIILTANQVSSLSEKEIEVVPTESIPQGVAALLSFNYDDADVETSALAMEKARLTVKTIEVTRAVRSTRIGDLRVKRGQIMGFLDGKLVTLADNPQEALLDVISNHAGIQEAEMVTVYYNADVSQAEATDILGKIRQRWPQVEVEVIYGGQPHYCYIASVE